MHNISFTEFLLDEKVYQFNEILKQNKLNCKFDDSDFIQLYSIVKGGISVKTFREYIRTILNSKIPYFNDKNDITETLAKFILNWYDDLIYQF